MMKSAAVMVLCMGTVGMWTTGCDFQMRSGSAGSGPALASGGEAADQPGAESTGAPASHAGTVQHAQPAAQQANASAAGQPASQGSTASAAPAEGSAASGEGSAASGEGSAASGGGSAATASAGGGSAGGGCFDQEHHLRCPEDEVREAYQQLAQGEQQLEALEEFRLADSRIPDLDEIRSKLVLLQQAQAVASQVRPFYDQFRQRYLSNRPDWMDESSAMNQRFQSIDNNATDTLLQVETRLGYIEQAPARNATNCLQKPTMEMEYIDSRNEMYRVRLLGEALTALDLCPRFDPGNAEVASQAEALRPRVNEMLEQYREQELEAARSRHWEGNVGRVSAGSPGALARAGLGYLRSQRDWGGNGHARIVAVSVRGDWFVATRNLFGQPAQWGLPIHVAVINPDTPEQMAQIYELSLVTPGAHKGGNFTEYRVGNTWRIMRSALPRGAR